MHAGCAEGITSDDDQAIQHSANETEVAELLADLANRIPSHRQSKEPVITEDKGIQVTSGDLGTKFLSTLTDINIVSFTGLPSMDLLDALVTCYENVAPLSGRHHLTAKERVVLTMMKLKHNMSFTFLSGLFGCSSSTCSIIVTQTVKTLARILSSVVVLPAKEEILRNMPKQFERYQNVRIVLDCTEVPVSQPKCLNCAINVYSYYKKAFTCKYMIGVTPGGIIAHVSKGYGGRASDKRIFEESGLVDQLIPFKDAVMVDRGFLIDSVCEANFIPVIRPPFKRKQCQLPKNAALETQTIAAARVHVERAIQRMKIFKILSTKVLWSTVPILDDIVIITAAVTNLSAPIFSSCRFL
ncbi:uncharacterized protein LOC135390517 [Ornithodoros turicata]|uniref:uncharacterized protein LOC135390517 n=1 Tax=Ornithodoros turicata TaxID=34597 RepID=UPI003138B1DB